MGEVFLQLSEQDRREVLGVAADRSAKPGGPGYRDQPVLSTVLREMAWSLFYGCN